MIRLCIFVLDGTLINSLKDLADCCNTVLADEGLPIHPLDAYRHFVGNGIPKLIERILPEGERTEEKMARTRERFDERYQVHCLDATKPYPGVVHLLDECRDKGILLAVLSNKADPFAKFICREIFGAKAFDAVSGQKAEVPKKPAPDGVFSLLKEFNTLPEESVLIGDSNVDILTAKNAGLHSIGACWGFRGREELKRAGAEMLADYPEECENIIFANNWK